MILSSFPCLSPIDIGPISIGIAQLILELREIPNCEVYPQRGVPELSMEIPSDLAEFYHLSGGAALFRGEPYSIEIVRPTQFVRANPIIIREDGEGDISFDWFIVARTEEQYITIDLAPGRLGRCYDSFWDRHGVAGECQVVANSFESLLQQLIKSRGGYWYWLEESFHKLGDAYDSA